MRPRPLLLLSLILLALPAMAGAASWRLQPGTSVAVDASWNGATIPIRFPSIAGRVEFDQSDLSATRAALAVATGDATTGLPLADGLVRSEGYLDAARFPQITFQLDRLVQTSKSTADVQGRITLRGVTKPMTFQATVIRYGPLPADPARFEAGFDVTGRIDRTAFGSTGGLPEVGAVMPIRIRLLMVSE